MLRPQRRSAVLKAAGAVVGLALLLAACSGDDADPTSTAEPVVAASTATATVEPPTPTSTVEPATPTPSPEPEPSATPTRSGPAPTVFAPIQRTATPVPPNPESTAEPTAATEPTADIPPDSSGDVQIGELLLESDLSDWEQVEFEFGSGFVADGSYHINVTQAEGSFIMLRSEQSDFGDVLVSLDVRMLAPATEAYGCVLSRTDYDYQYYYGICISQAAETFAIFGNSDANGEFQVDILFDLEAREGTNPVTEWNNLAVITYGEEIGFFVNDTFLGVTTHSGPLAGSAGFYVENYDPNGVEFEFANLQVWEVTGGATVMAR